MRMNRNYLKQRQECISGVRETRDLKETQQLQGHRLKQERGKERGEKGRGKQGTVSLDEKQLLHQEAFARTAHVVQVINDAVWN